jgi:hypothetical protein
MNEGYCLMGCNAVKFGGSLPMFRGTFCLLLQGSRVSQASNQHEAGNINKLIYCYMIECYYRQGFDW